MSNVTQLFQIIW